MNYKHIVLFKIYDQINEDRFQEALKILEQLGKGNPDIIQWSVKPTIDTRKGRIIIEDSIFKDEESFQKFRTSEAHNQASAVMKEISDWLVGDYLL